MEKKLTFFIIIVLTLTIFFVGDEVKALSDKQNSNLSVLKRESLSINEINSVRSRLAKCWNPPLFLIGIGTDKDEGKDFKVQVRIWLNSDGTVRQAEAIKDTSMEEDPRYKLFVERALNAVLDKNCNPLPFPEEKYELWKEIEITFDPKWF